MKSAIGSRRQHNYRLKPTYGWLKSELGRQASRRLTTLWTTDATAFTISIERLAALGLPHVKHLTVKNILDSPGDGLRAV
jgi:hypothetical protein